MSLALSFAAGLVLILSGTLASPPFTGVLYLAAALAGGVGARFLGKERGRGEEDARIPGEQNRTSWYEAVGHLQRPEHKDAEGRFPHNTQRHVLCPTSVAQPDRGYAASEKTYSRQ